jgi:glycine oxidase
MNAAPLPFRQAHVLGAGLMGRLVALTLARAGCEVSVHDAAGPDADQAAARVAAAMLAPLAESAIAPPALVRMGLHSLARWPQLLATLAQPVFFQQAGTLIVWHRQDAAEAERLAGTLRRTQETVDGLAPMQRLDATALTALEPALAGRFMRGCWLPGEGQLDNRGLLEALRAALEADARVTLHWHSPRSPDDFAPGPDARVIDCRGLGARTEWPQLRGVRGEVIRVHAPDVELHRPTRLVHPRYPLYIAPKPDHLFVIGATEIESQDLSPASVRSTMELLSAAYAVHPGFGEARIVEIATQCRPTLPDNRPALRWRGPRVLQINGLYRHGFMIAPAMLDAAWQCLSGDTPTLARDFEIDIDTGGRCGDEETET